MQINQPIQQIKLHGLGYKGNANPLSAVTSNININTSSNTNNANANTNANSNSNSNSNSNANNNSSDNRHTNNSNINHNANNPTKIIGKQHNSLIERIEEKLTLRGFKSLSRKNQNGNQNINSPMQDQNNKQNIKDNLNTNPNCYAPNRPHSGSTMQVNNGSHPQTNGTQIKKVHKNIEQYYQEQLYKINGKVKPDEDTNNRRQSSNKDKDKQSVSLLQKQKERENNKIINQSKYKYKQRSRSALQKEEKQNDKSVQMNKNNENGKTDNEKQNITAVNRIIQRGNLIRNKNNSYKNTKNGHLDANEKDLNCNEKRNRSSSTNKKQSYSRQSQKSRKGNKQNVYEGSPATNNHVDNMIHYNYKLGSNKAFNSNTKLSEESNGQHSSAYGCQNPTVSCFKSPAKQNYTFPTSSASIICQSVSKDGGYRIVSRALQQEELKEAVQLEYNINAKAKKQAIRQLMVNSGITYPQGQMQMCGDTVTPRQAKYVLDPSKISNKQNGNVKAYAVNSNQGISRKYNEDRVSIILNITKNNVKASYFAIYDGHGGSNCCDFLTQNLHQYIFNSKHFPSQPRQALIQGMKLAETKFIQLVKNNFKQKKQLDRSGSCAIILLLVGSDCYIANLGDSRAVLSTCHGKPMYSLSRDHKPTDPGEQARIFKQGGKIYRTQMFKLKKQKNSFEKRQEENKNLSYENEVIVGPLRVYPGKLSVTRTFGDIQAKQPQFGGMKNCISIDPQICKYSITGKQDFILLGCDGVFQKLDSEEVIEEVWKTIKKDKNSPIHEVAGNAAQSVVKLCMDRKSTDNITIILVCLGSLDLETNLIDYASV